MIIKQNDRGTWLMLLVRMRFSERMSVMILKNCLYYSFKLLRVAINIVSRAVSKQLTNTAVL